jgi:hypothetical protein
MREYRMQLSCLSVRDFVSSATFLHKVRANGLGWPGRAATSQSYSNLKDTSCQANADLLKPREYPPLNLGDIANQCPLLPSSGPGRLASCRIGSAQRWIACWQRCSDKGKVRGCI